jgi:hypothetical protein
MIRRRTGHAADNEDGDGDNSKRNKRRQTQSGGLRKPGRHQVPNYVLVVVVLFSSCRLSATLLPTLASTNVPLADSQESECESRIGLICAPSDSGIQRQRCLRRVPVPVPGKTHLLPPPRYWRTDQKLHVDSGTGRHTQVRTTGTTLAGTDYGPYQHWQNYLVYYTAMKVTKREPSRALPVVATKT